MSHDYFFCAVLLVLVVRVWKNFFFIAVILQAIGNTTGALWFYSISFFALISIMALCISYVKLFFQSAGDKKCYKIVLIVKPKLRLYRLPSKLHNNCPLILTVYFTVMYVVILKQFEFKRENLGLMENFETGESAAKLVTDVAYKLYVTFRTAE